MRLGQRITLEKPVRIADDYGEQVITWTPVGDVWANVRPLRAVEIARNQQAQLYTTHTVTIRYRADVQTDWRAVYHDAAGRHVLNLSGRIDVNSRHHWLELTAVEVTNG